MLLFFFDSSGRAITSALFLALGKAGSSCYAQDFQRVMLPYYQVNPLYIRNRLHWDTEPHECYLRLKGQHCYWMIGNSLETMV